MTVENFIIRGLQTGNKEAFSGNMYGTAQRDFNVCIDKQYLSCLELQNIDKIINEKIVCLTGINSGNTWMCLITGVTHRETYLKHPVLLLQCTHKTTLEACEVIDDVSEKAVG